MKLDPGIHIVMHSVLSLKSGVTTSAVSYASPHWIFLLGGEERGES